MGTGRPFRKPHKLSREERRKVAVWIAEHNGSVKHIAELYGITQGTCLNYVKAEGYVFGWHKPRREQYDGK